MLKKVFFILILSLIGLYYVPIMYNEHEGSSEKVSTVNNVMLTREDEEVIYPLPVSGFEYYVDQPLQSYLERYGNPDEILKEETNGKSWYMYYTEDLNRFIQLEVEENIIKSLFVLGSDIQTGAIQIGMTRQNIYDETKLARTFDFESEGEVYSLTLDRKEWEYFPLVQFDNSSFAMLYFHPETHKIYGIRYLSFETLVALDYYTIEASKSLFSDSAYIQTSHLLATYMNAMRSEYELPLMQHSVDLKEFGGQVLESEGISALTFGNYSEPVQEQLEKERRQIIYNVGENWYDPPLRFGLLFLEEKNRQMFLNPDYMNFSISVMHDDLLVVFEAERVESDDY